MSTQDKVEVSGSELKRIRELLEAQAETNKPKKPGLFGIMVAAGLEAGRDAIVGSKEAIQGKAAKRYIRTAVEEQRELKRLQTLDAADPTFLNEEEREIMEELEKKYPS